jgi:hypothetical protein
MASDVGGSRLEPRRQRFPGVAGVAVCGRVFSSVNVGPTGRPDDAGGADLDVAERAGLRAAQKDSPAVFLRRAP